MHKLSKQSTNTKPPAAGKGKRRWSLSRKERPQDQHHVRTPSGKWIKTEVGLDNDAVDDSRYSDDQRTSDSDHWSAEGAGPSSAPQIPAWHLSRPPIRWDPHSNNSSSDHHARSRSDSNNDPIHDPNDSNEHFTIPPAPVPFPMSARKAKHKPGSLYPMHNPIKPDRPYINWHLRPPDIDLPPIFTNGYVKPDPSLGPPPPSNNGPPSAGGNSPASLGKPGLTSTPTVTGQGPSPSKETRSHPPTIQPPQHGHSHSLSVTTLHQATSAILGHSTSHQSLHKYANSQDDPPPPSATLPRSTSETALNHMAGQMKGKKSYNYVAAPDPESLLDLTDAWGAQWHHSGPYDLGRRGPGVKIPAILQTNSAPAVPSANEYHHATVPHQKRKPPTTGPHHRRPSHDPEGEPEGRRRKDSGRSGLKAMFYAGNTTDDEADNGDAGEPGRISHERQRTTSTGYGRQRSESTSHGRPRGESTSDSRLKPGSARPSIDIQGPSPGPEETTFEKDGADEEGAATGGGGSEKTTTYNGRTVLSRKRTRSLGREESSRSNEPTRRPSQVGDRPLISHPTQLKRSPSAASTFHISNTASNSQPPPHMMKALSAKKSYSHLGHGGVTDGISSLIQSAGPRLRKLSKTGIGSGMNMGVKHKHSASLDHYHYGGGGGYNGMGGPSGEPPTLGKRTSAGVLNKLAKKLSFMGGVVSGKTREMEEREIMMKEKERMLREVGEKDRERERERERAISGVGAKPPVLGLGPGVGEKLELEEQLAGVSIEDEAVRQEMEESARQNDRNEQSQEDRRLPSDMTTSSMMSSPPPMSFSVSSPPSSHMSTLMVDPRSPGSRLSALRALQGQNSIPGTPPSHTIHSIIHTPPHHSPSVSSDDPTKSPMASIDTPFSPLGKFAALLSPKKPSNQFAMLSVGDLMPEGGSPSMMRRSREPSPNREIPERERTESPVLSMPKMTLTVTNPDPEPDWAEIEERERQEKERQEREKERRKKEREAVEREKERNRLERERERQEEERVQREREEEEREREQLCREREEREQERREAEAREEARLRQEREEEAKLNQELEEARLRQAQEDERREREERIRREREEERRRKDREEERVRKEREEKLRRELEEERLKKEREEERSRREREEERSRREREEERSRREREEERERERQKRRSSKVPSSTRQSSLGEPVKENKHERRGSTQMQWPQSSQPQSDPQPPMDTPGSPLPPPPPAKDYPPISRSLQPPAPTTSTPPKAKSSSASSTPPPTGDPPHSTRASTLGVSHPPATNSNASLSRESAIMSPVMGMMSPASTAIMSPVMGMTSPSATMLGVPGYGARASEIYGLGMNNGSGYLSVGYAIAPHQQSSHPGQPTPITVAYAVTPSSAAGSRSSDSLNHSAQNGIFTIQNGIMVVHPYGQQPPLPSFPPSQAQQSHSQQHTLQHALKSPPQLPHSPYPPQHYSYPYPPFSPHHSQQNHAPPSQHQQQRQPSPPRPAPPAQTEPKPVHLSNPLPVPPQLVKSMSQKEREGLVITSTSSSSQTRKTGSSSSSASKPPSSSSSAPKQDQQQAQPSHKAAGRPSIPPKTGSDPLTTNSSKHPPHVRSETTIPPLGKQWESVVDQMAQRHQHKKSRSGNDDQPRSSKKKYVEYGGRMVEESELEKIKEIERLAKEHALKKSSQARPKEAVKASTVAPTPPPKNDVLPAIQVSKMESSPESSVAPTPPPKTPGKLPRTSRPAPAAVSRHPSDPKSLPRAVSEVRVEADILSLKAQEAFARDRVTKGTSLALDRTSLVDHIPGKTLGPEQRQSVSSRSGRSSKRMSENILLGPANNLQTGHQSSHRQSYSFANGPSAHLGNPMPRPPRDMSADLQAR